MFDWFTSESAGVVLPIIGQGLCGVFLVIGVLALSVALLNRLTGGKKEPKE